MSATATTRRRRRRARILRRIAEKYNITPAEARRIILRYAFALAKQRYRPGVDDWRKVVGQALREVWSYVKSTESLPGY